MRNRLPCSIGFPPLPDRDSHQRGHLVGIGLGSNRITQLQVCAPGLHRGQPTDSKSAKCCDARLSRPTRKKDPSSWALRFRVVQSRGWTSPFRFPQSHSSAMLGLLKHVALADRTGKARLRSLELGCTLPVPAFCPRRRVRCPSRPRPKLAHQDSGSSGGRCGSSLSSYSRHLFPFLFPAVSHDLQMPAGFSTILAITPSLPKNHWAIIP